MPAKSGHRYAPDYRQATAVLLARLVPGLDEAAALQALQQARAWHSHALLDLHDHLIERPDALRTGSSACPASLIRLIHVLRGDGRDDVVAPACVGCGAARLDMPTTTAGTAVGVTSTGRLCLPCYRRARRQACARCGRATKAAHRRPDGIICWSCRDAEPASQGRCPSCGYTRPLRRRRTGELSCDTCMSRPCHTCIGCGRLVPAEAITAAGAVCRRCHGRPARRCGGCGNVRPVSVKATAGHPDLCHSCRPRTVGDCATCGRRTFVNRTDRGRGAMLCQTCQPKRHHPCSRCGAHSPASAIWPTGPVCRACYQATKRRPATCGRCRHVRVLIARDTAGTPICGRCADATIDYLCHRCHQGDQPPWHHGLCARCALTDTVAATLGTDPTAPLHPVTVALLAHPEPARVLQWLNTTATAALLTTLAHADSPITHRTIDELGRSNQAHLLRHMLVAAAVLPPRLEHLERIGPWLDTLLRGIPAARARIVRQYTRWALIHRSRRNAATIGFSPQAGNHLKAKVRAVLDLLDWLDQHGTNLRQATQTHLDTWLAGGPAMRPVKIRAFINWAREHRYTGNIAVPAGPEPQPRLKPLTDDEANQQLRRCLHDTTLPNDVRLAGALILLFGTTTARLVRLHTDAVLNRGNHTMLHLGRVPLTLPPPLAAIALAQAAAPQPIRSPAATIARTSLLFPGRSPDQPIAASRLRDKLRRHGITPVPGRHAAIVSITADIPAPILADLLGVTATTAIRWANAVSTDWTHYLAAREPAPASGGEAPPTSPHANTPRRTRGAKNSQTKT